MTNLLIPTTTKPIKFVIEESEEPIYIKTPQELEEVLHEVVNGVSSYNAKIDFDLIKNTRIGMINI